MIVSQSFVVFMKVERANCVKKSRENFLDVAWMYIFSMFKSLIKTGQVKHSREIKDTCPANFTAVWQKTCFFVALTVFHKSPLLPISRSPKQCHSITQLINKTLYTFQTSSRNAPQTSVRLQWKYIKKAKQSLIDQTFKYCQRAILLPVNSMVVCFYTIEGIHLRTSFSLFLGWSY